MSHKFVNIHELISHNPSCLNRDDMNMQKSAVFGGVRRARISSQCLKRAYRNSDGYKDKFKSIRTTKPELMIQEAKNQFSSTDSVIIEYVLSKTMPKDNVMTAWIKGEIGQLIQTVEEAIKDDREAKLAELKKIVDSKPASDNAADDNEKKSGKKKSKDDLDAALTKAIEAAEKQFLKSGISSIDVALSGRMCASSILEDIEAAMSMAHAITTHAMDAEIDWFTAMDDLKEEADDAGAGHLNTQEFGAGVFYQYASVDVDLLAKNMGTDRNHALGVISDYIRIMATTTPTGKQHSFASHSLAHCVMVSVSEMPLALANAFENPVKKGRDGFVAASTKAMIDYWTKLHNAYGIDEETAVFSLDPQIINDGKIKTFDTMSALQEWIKKED